MQWIRYIFPLFVFTVQLAETAGQTPVIDSLKNSINKAAPGKETLITIVVLSEQGINADTLLPYVVMAENIATETKSKSDADKAFFCRAYYYVRKNLTDSALTIAEALIADYKTDKSQQPFYLKLLFFKAKILDRANQYTKALVQLMEVIQTAETLKDTLIQIQAKTGIGWVQMEMEQYKEALQWLYKAKNTSSNKKFYKNYGALYSNIANAYNALGKADSARHYIKIAIKDARENNNLNFLATALSMQAKIFIDNKQSHLAEAPLNEVLEIRKKLNDPFYIVYDMSSLASYYANNNQAQKGIDLCKQGIALAKQSGLSSQLLMVYHSLAENYKAAGSTVEYGKTLEAIIALKDSFNNINSAKLLSDMQASNETQRNEKKIMEQKLTLTKKNYWLYGSFLFTLMTGIIVWLGFKNYRRKQKIKMQLALEEEKRHVADAVKKAEERERVRIAADLHDNLGTYAASMASNLSHIQAQDADEKTSNALSELKNNSNDIVSQLNDTIWVLKKDSLLLTAISDRVKVFISRIRNSYPEVNIEVKEKIETDFLLPSSQAFHLYRVVQEAVNNSLKHSNGKNVAVEIIADVNWKVSVEDDGIGVKEYKESSGGGNGLINMKERSKEAGWDIKWMSNGGKGTVVEISPTTN